jgi:ABC-2 type transport system ATP-binding protein
VAGLLSVSGLGKAYGGHPVVADFDLRLEPGGALALLGPNGVGKSTVLRCLSGHERPDTGEFALDGVGGQVASSAWRAAVFPIFDDFAFFPDLTVGEHLEFLAGLYGPEDVEPAAEVALERFGVAAVAGQFPDALSSGQIRRVAFAAAAIRPWRVLLLDEPEQRLDTDGKDRLVAFVRGQLSEGRGVVLATHDSELAGRLGARTVTLGRAG